MSFIIDKEAYGHVTDTVHYIIYELQGIFMGIQYSIK